jgi:hypothetical protein
LRGPQTKRTNLEKEETELTLPFISLHQRGYGGGEFFELVGIDFGILEVE